MNFNLFYNLITEAELGSKQAELLQQGKEIAKKLGLRFNGIQEDLRDGSFHSFVFTDMAKTKSTFMATSLEDAIKELEATRKKFKDVE